MRAHRGSGGSRIAGVQRVPHDTMFGNHGLDIGGARLFEQQRAVWRGRAQTPHFLDLAVDHGVARRRGDEQVEGAVRFGADTGQKIFFRHLLHQPVEFFQFIVPDVDRGQRRRFAFDQKPRFHQFEGGDGEARPILIAGQRADIGTGTDPHLDQPLDFQRDHRLAHGRTADAVHDRQLALGRQAVANRIAAGRQILEQSACQLLI